MNSFRFVKMAFWLVKKGGGLMMEQGSGPSTQAVEFSQDYDAEPEIEFPEGNQK